MARIEDIGGLPVRIEDSSLHASSVRRAIALVCQAIPIDRVTTDFGHGRPQIRYSLTSPRVTVEATSQHDVATIMRALEASRRTIDGYEAKAVETRVMDAADATLARTLRCSDALRTLERAGQNRLRLYLWPSAGHSVLRDDHSVKLQDGCVVHLMDRHVSVARMTDEETWSQGNLITGRRLHLPDTVIATLKGRMLDDVVSGSMLAGGDLVIRNAWLNGGRLGLNFRKRDIPVKEVIESIEATMRIAA